MEKDTGRPMRRYHKSGIAPNSFQNALSENELKHIHEVCDALAQRYGFMNAQDFRDRFQINFGCKPMINHVFTGLLCQNKKYFLHSDSSPLNLQA